MHTGGVSESSPRERRTSADPERTRRSRRLAWPERVLGLFGGGTDGNEQLTALTGAILIVLLAVLGVTILRIRQLISVHLFVGLLLLGPVALKLASTGYRFVRYYSRDPDYVRKGPPELVMRLIAPIVVLTTVVVFASGIVLLFGGPGSRATWLPIHKVSFIVWLVFTALHVLGHLPQMPAALRAARPGEGRARKTAGDAGRWIALAGAIVGGVVLAIAVIPHFGVWTAHGAFPPHRHHVG